MLRIELHQNLAKSGFLVGRLCYHIRRVRPLESVNYRIRNRVHIVRGQVGRMIHIGT